MICICKIGWYYLCLFLLLKHVNNVRGLKPCPHILVIIANKQLPPIWGTIMSILANFRHKSIITRLVVSIKVTLKDHNSWLVMNKKKLICTSSFLMEGNFIRRFIMLALIGIIVDNPKIYTSHMLGSMDGLLFLYHPWLYWWNWWQQYQICSKTIHFSYFHRHYYQHYEMLIFVQYIK